MVCKQKGQKRPRTKEPRDASQRGSQQWKKQRSFLNVPPCFSNVQYLTEIMEFSLALLDQLVSSCHRTWSCRVPSSLCIGAGLACLGFSSFHTNLLWNIVCMSCYGKISLSFRVCVRHMDASWCFFSGFGYFPASLTWWSVGFKAFFSGIINSGAFLYSKVSPVLLNELRFFVSTCFLDALRRISAVSWLTYFLSFPVEKGETEDTNIFPST